MEESQTYGNALPLQSMLLEYRLESVLGQGGFGITYLGRDTHLEKHVAIKEYLPGSLAMRALDGSVVPVNTDHKYNYQWGLQRFIQEARTLARFSHPNIVRVNRFFEANGTSYMVMDYEAGQSLNQYLRQTGTADEAALRSILLPILEGLQAVHEAGFLHRDIKPSNVFVRENGTPVLLDFGAARMAADGSSKSLTAIVSAGYAPLEQYMTDGNQGPWSDIYALAGVMFRGVTGENPPEAVKRIKADTVMQALANARTRYSEAFLRAIERGLMPDEKARPQTVAAWREMLLAREPLVVRNTVPAGAALTRSAAPAAKPAGHAAAMRNPAKSPRSTRALHRESSGYGKWLLAAIALVVIAAGVTWWKRPRPQTPAPQPAVQQQTAPTQVEPQPTGPTQAAAQPSTPVPPEPQTALPQNSVPQVNEPSPRAEPRPPQSLPPPGLQVLINKEFDGVDRDGDGYLSQQEIRGRFPFVERNFSLVDQNHDGRISAEEFRLMRIKQRSMKHGLP